MKGKKSNSRQELAVVLERQIQLAKKMTEGLGYHETYQWYHNNYGLAEKTFQKDRTIIYKQWKVESSREIEDKKVELVNALKEDRKSAREIGNFNASIQALKLIAQIEGVLNKQNESTINIQNNTLNLENVSDEVLVKAIENLTKKQNGQ